jgi:hypothetical protein
MQPNCRVSLGAGRAKTEDGTIAGAEAVTAAAFMKLRRFILASYSVTHDSTHIIIAVPVPSVNPN